VTIVTGESFVRENHWIVKEEKEREKKKRI